MANEPFYGDVSPVSAGIAGKCPRCGRGKLFSGYLTVADGCRSCRLDYGFADAGDGAAWFVMLITSIVAVGIALWIEVTWQPAYWVHALVALPITLLLAIVLLRPAKGILLCQQYKTDAASGEAAER